MRLHNSIAALFCVTLLAGATSKGFAQDNSPAAVDDVDETPAPDFAYGAYQRGLYLTAFELALPRAKIGDPAAQTLIAQLYDRGLGVARDGKKAAAWYAIAAKNDNLEAQFAYALKLLEGRYVAPDPAHARRLMQAAADGGHATAAFNYAQIVLDDRPTAEGVKLAMPYLRSAAGKGVAEAYFALAQIYRSGKLNGYPEDQKAQEWLLKAAKAGIDTAQVELGIWLANGAAGVQDEKAAYGWIRRAAIGGNVVARNRLAKMLVQGIGTQPNRVEAAMWHILARRAGLADPQLDEFLKTLNTDQLAEAQAAADNWPVR